MEGTEQLRKWSEVVEKSGVVGEMARVVEERILEVSKSWARSENESKEGKRHEKNTMPCEGRSSGFHLFSPGLRATGICD